MLQLLEHSEGESIETLVRRWVLQQAMLSGGLVDQSKKEPEISWNEAITLAEWCEIMLRQGYPEIVRHMINSLPDNSETKIRVLKFMKAMEARKK